MILKPVPPKNSCWTCKFSEINQALEERDTSFRCNFHNEWVSYFRPIDKDFTESVYCDEFKMNDSLKNWIASFK